MIKTKWVSDIEVYRTKSNESDIMHNFLYIEH